MSMIGKTIPHYQITSQLGKGGTEEVSRADKLSRGREL
jgi:hypothetical protein